MHIFTSTCCYRAHYLVVRFNYSTGKPGRFNPSVLYCRNTTSHWPLCRWLPQGPRAGSGVQCAETRRFVSGDPWDRRPRPGRVQGHRSQQAAVAGQDSATRGTMWVELGLNYCQKMCRNLPDNAGVSVQEAQGLCARGSNSCNDVTVKHE